MMYVCKYSVFHIINERGKSTILFQVKDKIKFISIKLKNYSLVQIPLGVKKSLKIDYLIFLLKKISTFKE